ncbi:MAG: RodZ domain-containing protein [Dyella sp.]
MKQSTTTGSDYPETHQLGAMGPDRSSIDPIASESFGARLRAMRERRGLGLDACAQALRLPSKVLRQIESDEQLGTDSQVYLSSYVGKYARHLGLDEESIHAAQARLKTPEPPLVATGGISHSRYLLERYATAATYVVLTAVIVVPMVWLGVHGALDRDMSHLSPLDAAPVAQQDAPATVPAPSGTALATQSKPALAPSAAQSMHVDEQPLMASMVPNLSGDGGLLANKSAEVLPVPVAPVVAPDQVGSGQHALQLNLINPSWVEVTDKSGQRLEYGLLPAGSSKTYHSDQPLEVRIGNANGAQVNLDGQSMPLDDYRRANVAHFRVAIQDGKATPSGV